jgi:hypothetical protein
MSASTGLDECPGGAPVGTILSCRASSDNRAYRTPLPHEGGSDRHQLHRGRGRALRPRPAFSARHARLPRPRNAKDLDILVLDSSSSSNSARSVAVKSRAWLRSSNSCSRCCCSGLGAKATICAAVGDATEEGVQRTVELRRQRRRCDPDRVRHVRPRSALTSSQGTGACPVAYVITTAVSRPVALPVERRRS